MHGLELADGAAQQDDFGAGARQCQRNRASQAIAGAGDHDDPAAQLIGLRCMAPRIEFSGQFLVSSALLSSAGELASLAGSRTSCSMGSSDSSVSLVTPSSVNLR